MLEYPFGTILAWPNRSIIVKERTMQQGTEPTASPNGAGRDERQLSWDTSSVAARMQFAYYREAICKIFMNLTPEEPDKAPFEAKIESVKIGRAAVNRVTFPSHKVMRLKSDIDASDRACFYLNLKLQGECCISQHDRSVMLSPGDVGLFDSEYPFEILHKKSTSLRVASFWIPKTELADRLPAGFDVRATKLSSDPVLGHLVAETARALNGSLLRLTEADGQRLFDILLDLVALSLSRTSDVRTDAPIARAATIMLRRTVNGCLKQPGLSVRHVARLCGISERYVHKLFAGSNTTFSRYLMEQRLGRIAVDLRNPDNAARPIGDIAFEWGFSDLSHFSRSFRRRYQCSPTEWRYQR
jgi:AraC-like DNA-binding protein